MIDLHMHSTFSDGSLRPSELVARAREIGLTAIALTDHDCTDGIPPLMEACRAANAAHPDAPGLVCVPGVEISVDVPRGTMHMLGYFIDPAGARLRATLARIQGGRADRNREILAKINALGMNLAWEDVKRHATEDVVGRPHFARALVERGYVSSTAAAFERYLAKGKPAYADRFRLSPEAGIAAIREAGGAPVLAHPFTLEADGTGLRAELERLKAIGLEGLEVFYSEHTPAQTQEYGRLARELDLAMTGGSDFHGALNPAIKMGVGFGSLQVDDGLLEGLRRRARHTAGGFAERA
ncbi:MAG: PHP domain-containing protein [Lentisphaerae bacterium]|nr:PHP domain-containing protein [Lentisphaerota bacterium]